MALDKHHPEVFVLISSTKTQKTSPGFPTIVQASKQKYSRAPYKNLLILTLPHHIFPLRY